MKHLLIIFLTACGGSNDTIVETTTVHPTPAHIHIDESEETHAIYPDRCHPAQGRGAVFGKHEERKACSKR